MQKKPDQYKLTGLDASILTLLAQSKSLTEEQHKSLLSRLNGKALEIANAIIYESEEHSDDAIISANGYKKWAANLSRKYEKV